MAVEAIEVAPVSEVVGEEERGRKYRYICVVKRFGMLVGVIQRVKGRRPSRWC